MPNERKEISPSDMIEVWAKLRIASRKFVTKSHKQFEKRLTALTKRGDIKDRINALKKLILNSSMGSYFNAPDPKKHIDTKEDKSRREDNLINLAHIAYDVFEKLLVSVNGSMGLFEQAENGETVKTIADPNPVNMALLATKFNTSDRSERNQWLEEYAKWIKTVTFIDANDFQNLDLASFIAKDKYLSARIASIGDKALQDEFVSMLEKQLGDYRPYFVGQALDQLWAANTKGDHMQEIQAFSDGLEKNAVVFAKTPEVKHFKSILKRIPAFAEQQEFTQAKTDLETEIDRFITNCAKQIGDNANHEEARIEKIQKQLQSDTPEGSKLSKEKRAILQKEMSTLSLSVSIRNKLRFQSLKEEERKRIVDGFPESMHTFFLEKVVIDYENFSYACLLENSEAKSEEAKAQYIKELDESREGKIVKQMMVMLAAQKQCQAEKSPEKAIQGVADLLDRTKETFKEIEPKNQSIFKAILKTILKVLGTAALGAYPILRMAHSQKTRSTLQFWKTDEQLLKERVHHAREVVGPRKGR